jgi:hypothetical protein
MLQISYAKVDETMQALWPANYFSWRGPAKDCYVAVGGPRAGGGAAVRTGALVAVGPGGTKNRGATCATAVEMVPGGAQIPAHRGQFKLGTDLVPLLSWLPAAIFMASMAAQWGAADVALTKGEAMATPRKSANHTSTKRVIRWALRRVCIE